jgi:hypothetical protein
MIWHIDGGMRKEIYVPPSPKRTAQQERRHIAALKGRKECCCKCRVCFLLGVLLQSGKGRRKEVHESF